MTCQSAFGFAPSGFVAAGGVTLGFAADDFVLAVFARASHASASKIAPTMEKARSRTAIIHYNMQEKCQWTTSFPMTDRRSWTAATGHFTIGQRNCFPVPLRMFKPISLLLTGLLAAGNLFGQTEAGKPPA